MSGKKRPGRAGTRHRSKQIINNTVSLNLNSVSSLAVERAIRLAKSLPARESEIHAKVLQQLQDCGLPAPDHFLIVVQQVSDVQADAERMAQEKDGSVLICNVDGKILAYARPERSNLKPDLDEAVGFLQKLRPGGPWTLIAERDGVRVVTQTCTSAEAVRRFVAFWNVDHNIGIAPYQ
jgi:hypothetical protein